MPTEEDVNALEAMPKESWFAIGDIPIEHQYKTLIYFLEERPTYNRYTLVASPHFLRFMWQKNPS